MVKKIYAAHQAAINKALEQGLTPAQIRVVNAFDAHFDENPEAPTLADIVRRSGLPYGTVQAALPVLEHFGYLHINRTRKGRNVKRGVVLIIGFDETKGL